MLSSEHWGVRPILFYLDHWSIPSYSFFVALALLIGISVFVVEAYRNDHFGYETWVILCAALIFGSLGAKLPIWIGHYHEVCKFPPNMNLLWSGRTIIGALIGGVIGVIWVKRLLKFDLKLGGEIAPAIAIGMAVGRVGCFLRGCCYGIPTHTKWGVNFGDGILRYPTQLVESLFSLILFLVLLKLRKQFKDPALLFRIFLLTYLVFRFFIEFLRVSRHHILGLSLFQWTSCFVLLILYRKNLIHFFNQPTSID